MSFQIRCRLPFMSFLLKLSFSCVSLSLVMVLSTFDAVVFIVVIELLLCFFLFILLFCCRLISFVLSYFVASFVDCGQRFCLLNIFIVVSFLIDNRYESMIDDIRFWYSCKFELGQSADLESIIIGPNSQARLSRWPGPSQSASIIFYFLIFFVKVWVYPKLVGLYSQAESTFLFLGSSQISPSIPFMLLGRVRPMTKTFSSKLFLCHVILSSFLFHCRLLLFIVIIFNLLLISNAILNKYYSQSEC